MGRAVLIMPRRESKYTLVTRRILSKQFNDNLG